MITFHKILAGCEAGTRESWRAFTGEYTPLAFHLSDVYLAGARAGREELWRQTLAALAANDFENLRALGCQEEREFLVGLRRFLLERGGAGLDAAGDSALAPPPTPESVATLLEGLPLLHQEVLFLKLAGYSDTALEKMLRITPVVARKGLERLAASDGDVLSLESNGGQWPSAWLGLLRHAWAAKTDACAPLRLFIRIQDGQAGWQDKDPVEQHTARCLTCLESMTSLAEVACWRREAPRQPAPEIEPLISGLPLMADVPVKKSLFQRMFGGGG